MGKRVLEHKPAEEALIDSEKLYRLIVENVTDIIWIVDMEMKFTYYSPSFIQMRGYSVEEAMAQSVEKSMTPASFESAMKIIVEELELHYKGERDPAKSRKMEAELTCKDGSTVWTEIEANFIYNSEGQPTGILGITRNITERKESEKERKRAEKALWESKDKFKHVFDHSVIGKSITFFSGEMQANEAFYEMLGYSKEKFLDLKWQQITHPDDIELSQKVVDSLLSGEKDSDRFIKRYLHKNGSVVWADVSTVLRWDKEGIRTD